MIRANFLARLVAERTGESGLAFFDLRLDACVHTHKKKKHTGFMEASIRKNNNIVLTLANSGFNVSIKIHVTDLHTIRSTLLELARQGYNTLKAAAWTYEASIFSADPARRSATSPFTPNYIRRRKMLVQSKCDEVNVQEIRDIKHERLFIGFL